MIVMARSIALAAILAVSFGTASKALAQESDLLANQTVVFDSKDPNVVLTIIRDNIGEVYKLYKPVAQLPYSLSKPKTVTGPMNRPVLSMAFTTLGFSETEFVGEIFVIESKTGSCARNLLIVTDLKKSAERVTNEYKELKIDACFNIVAGGKGEMKLVATAIRAPSFSGSPVQGLILNLLKMQAQPLTKALVETIEAVKKEKGL